MLPKIISTRCKLVKLCHCHICRSGPVFFGHTVVVDLSQNRFNRAWCRRIRPTGGRMQRHCNLGG